MDTTRKLFSFKKNEIDQAFKTSRQAKKALGFKLLKAPSQGDFGKLLIIIPRKSGKACKRNVIRRRAQSIFYEERLFKKPALFILYVSKYGIDCPFDQLKKFLTNGCA